MRVKILLAAVLMLALGVTDTAAQDTTTTTVEPTQSVQIFFVACADQAVVNLSGTLLPGWDIYYQVFGGAGGTGTALTGLRQVQANDAFAFSERPGYPEGSTLGPGSIGSVHVFIGREGNPDTTDFDTTVDDVQDGCSSPQNAEAESVDLGGGAGGGGAEAAEPIEVQPDILAPGNGVLNPNREVEDLVEIGARQSDYYRSGTPGLIFAECDEYPEAATGVVYDTDNVAIFWSWFARDQETMQQHLANANYSVKINTARLPDPVVTGPEERDGDVWVFYTVPVGNMTPGHYEIEFKLSWNQPISDGYDNYGPGTAHEQILSLCNFDIIRNPSGGETHPNLGYVPSSHPVHDIDPLY